MVETVEQAVLRLSCDGATTLAVTGALKDAGLLKARVIRLCPTCGGTCFRTRTLYDDASQPYHETDLCPDCANAPTFVIASEAWEVFKAAYREWRDQEQTIAVEHAALTDILQALLPGARVAKEVGRFCAGNRETGEAAYLDTGVLIETFGDAASLPDINEGDPIAILEDD